MTRRAQQVSYTVPVGHPGSSCSVDWRWPDVSLAQWRMSEKDGVAWISAGHLNEKGRQAILEHFDLTDAADDLPLQSLMTRSPNELELMHFGRASLSGQVPREHVSDRIGGHILALEAV